jgi:N-formylglutamate deformylase
MKDLFHFHRGTAPILISMPHSGVELPDSVWARLSDAARLLPDTDWHVPRLYGFAEELGASVLQARPGRYLVDLNRPPDDASLYPGQVTTGLCPTTLFDGSPLYVEGGVEGGAPTPEEIADRRVRYWQPYHDQLAAELERIRGEFGYALLYDAHSIASRVPRLFQGRLPDLNLGTFNGTTCAPACERAIAMVMGSGDYTQVVNGRFRGGYITRHYGRPREGVHAVQMEIAQCAYMDETAGYPYNPDKAERLQPALRGMLEAFLGAMTA